MIDLDRLKATIAAWLQPLERRIDYSAFYEAKVIAQNADGSLELEPLTPKLPPISGVAIRYGVPGVTAKIKQGGVALVGFANQSPSKPFAIIVDGASIESLSLFDGDRPVARVGDVVTIPFPPAMPITGTVNGLPLVGVITVIQPASGIIQTGRSNVLA